MDVAKQREANRVIQSGDCVVKLQQQMSFIATAGQKISFHCAFSAIYCGIFRREMSIDFCAEIETVRNGDQFGPLSVRPYAASNEVKSL